MAPPLDPKLLNGLRLALEGEHQYLNAGLAILLCSTWLKRTGHLEDSYLEHTVSSTVRSYSYHTLFMVYFIACFCHNSGVVHLSA